MDLDPIHINISVIIVSVNSTQYYVIVELQPDVNKFYLILHFISKIPSLYISESISDLSSYNDTGCTCTYFGSYLKMLVTCIFTCIIWNRKVCHSSVVVIINKSNISNTVN